MEQSRVCIFLKNQHLVWFQTNHRCENDIVQIIETQEPEQCYRKIVREYWFTREKIHDENLS